MPPGTQRYQRTKMVLPLRVWVDKQRDDSALQLAHTLDISPIGARLGGLRTPIEPGQPITVQRGQHKTAFRVIWSRQLAPSEIQAGVETLEFGKKLWDIELPQQPVAADAAGAQPAAAAKPAATSKPAKPGSAKPAAVASTGFKNIERGPAMPASSSSAAASSSFVFPKDLEKRAQWVVGAAMVIFVGLLGLFAHHAFFGKGDITALVIPVAAPPTTAQLDAMTPKPVHIAPVRKVEDPNPAPRVQVAEAPKGRVVYPVSPNASMTGKVDLKVVIATDGRVKHVEVVSGKQLLAQAAEQAVRLWHYAQHQLNGAPAEAETSVTISFRGDDAVSIRFPDQKFNPIRAN